MTEPAVHAQPTIVYNPLPLLLAHYEKALLETLRAGGTPSLSSVPAASFELGETRAWRKISPAVNAIRAYGKLVRDDAHVIVCWPGFGLLEPLVWRRPRSRARVTVVVHDPAKLRRQSGTGKFSSRLGAMAVGGGLEVVVHSEPALECLARLGWPQPRFLPIPIMRTPATISASALVPAMVSVCGQYKPARDIGLMESLGPLLLGAGYLPVVAGRGWSALKGWQVREGFLPDAVLDDHIASSTCVVVPYRRFFQSDIAVRALEAGVPVVGPRHPFLEDLLGRNWPGLVDGTRAEDWLGAVKEVATKPRSEVLQQRDAYASRSALAWRKFLSGTKL